MIPGTEHPTAVRPPKDSAREERLSAFRGSSRRWRRHASLGLGSVILVAVVYAGVPSPRGVVRLSLALAYVSLVLLAATLLIGPLHRARGGGNPINSMLRRDVGIWGGVLALLHVAAGLQVHMNGRIAHYFVYPPGEPSSRIRDALLSANYLGLGATLAILTLLAISNDRALLRLGAARWKRWQRWNYGVFAMVAVHGIVYQLVEKRAALPMATFVAIVLAVGGVRLACGWRTRRTADPLT